MISAATGEGSAASTGGGKPLASILKLGLSGCVLGVLLWLFRDQLPSLRQVDAGATLATVGLLLLQPILIGLRWRCILYAMDCHVPSRALIGITWISTFANQFLPASVGGDAVRTLALSRRGEPVLTALGSIVIDRFLALVALCFVALAVVPWHALAPGALTAVWCVLIGGTLAILAGCAIHASRAGRITDLLRAKWPRLSTFLLRWLAVLRPLASPVILICGLAFSLLVHILSLLAFVLIARGVGITVPFWPLLGIGAALIFVQVLPVSISGWGVREAAAIGLLGTVGVGSGPALLTSVVLGLSYAAASLPGAAIWPVMRFSRSG